MDERTFARISEENFGENFNRTPGRIPGKI